MIQYILLIIAPISIFSLVRYNYIDRQALDFLQFTIVFFFLSKFKKTWILVALIAALTSTQIDGFGDYYWLLNFTILGMVFISVNSAVVSPATINSYSLPLVLYVFVKVVFDLAIGDYVEGGDRIAGPFTSSLHLAYFCVIYSFVIGVTNPSYKFLQIFLLLAAAVISGSRVGAAGVVAVLFFQLQANQRKLALLLLFAYFAVFGVPEVRVLSYIPDAEQIRIEGFYRYFGDLIFSDPGRAILGYGRKNYGAVGFRFFGEEVFITESSLIMLLYCYGAIFGACLFLHFCYCIFRLGQINNQIQASLVIILFVIFSPFIDSPAIFFINMALLSSINKAPAI